MSIKVLVADDSITIQKVIGIIFGGDEYSLTVVDNGKAAVDKAREINPDILLIDALMPGMTGYEVAEAVRSIPSLSAKPILILTGSFEPFDEEKAKKCGADDYIAKPFESQQIIAKVKELLEFGRSRAQSAQALQPQQPASETVRKQAPRVSATISDTPIPVIDQQQEAS
ncbi:MAG TPA: response regulator, partial [Desulfuromonadaceae bacterium]